MAEGRDDSCERVARLVRLGDELDRERRERRIRLCDYDGPDPGLRQDRKRIGDERPPTELQCRLRPAEPARGATRKHGTEGEGALWPGHAASLARPPHTNVPRYRLLWGVWDDC